MANKVVLGIDPGTATTGWSIVEEIGSHEQLIDCGAILTDKKDALPKRIAQIYDAVFGIIKKYRPNYLAIEELFFVKNVKTGIAVGQARGVILLCAEQAGLEICEFKPSEIKQAVCGYGAADKKQVQAMVKLRLGLEKPITQDDTADAVAIALTSLQTHKY